jgi:UbiD family decarboxylase
MDLSPVLTMTHIMRSVAGFYDLSFAKTFYKWDPQRMVASIHTRDLSRIVREYEERGEPAPMVNVLGHHPAFYLGAMAPSPWGTDDYGTLGAFLGESLRLVPSVTWGDRFLVPADAELVIEGEIPPGERDLCDPFGEVTGLYQAQCLRPVYQVKAITFRRGAIMQDVFSGYRDSYVGFHCIVKEAMLENALRSRFPEVVGIHCPESGSGMRSAYISVRRPSPARVEEIGQAALAISYLMQCVVLVDADIDVFDENQVLWALHTYADPEEGFKLQLGPGRATAAYMPRSGFGATNWGAQKVVIDATRPTHFAFELRSEVPRAAIERVPLADYLPGEV